jgi:predicted RNA-binding Zn-ribbon protein involved in translation (DUF1610 family)
MRIELINKSAVEVSKVLKCTSCGLVLSNTTIKACPMCGSTKIWKN